MAKADEESDRKGVVYVILKAGEFSIEEWDPKINYMYQRAVQDTPTRVTSLHKCIRDSRSSMIKLVDDFLEFAKTDTRVRVKIHQGKSVK
jgi:hypothetical protein